MMRPLASIPCGIVISASLAFSSAVVAQQVDVQIVVQELPNGTPLPASVSRKDKNGMLPIGKVDSEGKRTFKEADCSITTTYLATPDFEDDYWAVSEEGEPCKTDGPVLLQFYSRKFATVVGPFYGQSLPARWTYVPGNIEFSTTVTSVLAKNDYGTAAILAKAAADKLTVAGEFDLAKTYQEAATFWGVAAAVPKVMAAKPEGNYFAFDKPQNRFVLTFDGVDLMKQYQEANGIKDKDPLSWKTMRSLSDYVSAGGVSLGDFKAEALKPFNGDTLYVNNDNEGLFVHG